MQSVASSSKTGIFTSAGRTTRDSVNVCAAQRECRVGKIRTMLTDGWAGIVLIPRRTLATFSTRQELPERVALQFRQYRHDLKRYQSTDSRPTQSPAPHVDPESSVKSSKDRIPELAAQVKAKTTPTPSQTSILSRLTSALSLQPVERTGTGVEENPGGSSVRKLVELARPESKQLGIAVSLVSQVQSCALWRKLTSVDSSSFPAQCPCWSL